MAPASHKSEVLDNILFERSPIFGSAKNEEFLLAWKGIEVQSLLSDSTWWNINFANDFDFGESKIAIPSWIEGSSYSLHSETVSRSLARVSQRNYNNNWVLVSVNDYFIGYVGAQLAYHCVSGVVLLQQLVR